MPLDFDPFPTIDRGTPGEYSRVWAPVQREIAARVIVAPIDPLPRFVAGADCAFSKDGTSIYAVALVWDREEKRLVEVQTATRAVTTPYVSGFLSFREGPAILDAIAKLTQPFGAITFDGQGVAHPRRCGLATHLGVVLDVPSVGVAKSRLIGTHDDVGTAAGSTAALVDRGEPIGVVLRTKDKTNPLFVSVGHRANVASAIALARSCVTRYRVPEPTRLADIEVAKVKAASA
jgi:deoxyribonuclease V